MKILAGLDLSERSDRVFEAARAQALCARAHLWLVHVVAPDPKFVGYAAGPQTVRDSEAAHLRDRHQELQTMAETCRRQGIEATALLVQGPTAQMLLEEAAKLECDMIVIGSHGSGVITQLLGGSVSQAVLTRSERPVLVVPTR